MGYYPNSDSKLDSTPVDFVARAMVAIALQECNYVLHYGKPLHVLFLTLTQCIPGRHYDLRS